MKVWSRVLASLALSLSLILSSCGSYGIRTQAFKLTKGHSSFASRTSSSRALKDLQAKRNNPYTQIDSCFRRIPPSTSNPTQNKVNPP